MKQNHIFVCFFCARASGWVGRCIRERVRMGELVRVARVPCTAHVRGVWTRQWQKRKFPKCRFLLQIWKVCPHICGGFGTFQKFPDNVEGGRGKREMQNIPIHSF